jgi:hypothetical protein
MQCYSKAKLLALLNHLDRSKWAPSKPYYLHIVVSQMLSLKPCVFGMDAIVYKM